MDGSVILMKKTVPLYQLLVLGKATSEQENLLESALEEKISRFKLRLGKEVSWELYPETFTPNSLTSTAAVYFGNNAANDENLQELSDCGIPILPIVSAIDRVPAEIPEVLRPINCLDLSKHSMERIATGLLECVGLLPRQRRIFLSYRREESQEVAVQLFEELSSRLFDVFLDTHAIQFGEDFQETLWHRLCDCDVLLMLDTRTYFESRWTTAEFGRALAKGISVMRVSWPDSPQSAQTATSKTFCLSEHDICQSNGTLSDTVIEDLCAQLEQVRSESHAVRMTNLVSKVKTNIGQIGGKALGQGPNQAMYIKLANDTELVAYPTIGVPTSTTLHRASLNSPNQSVAVVYDDVGIHDDWLGHLNWLGEHIRTVKWVKAHRVAWDFADWEA